MSDLSERIDAEWKAAQDYAAANGLKVRILDPTSRLVEFVAQ